MPGSVIFTSIKELPGAVVAEAIHRALQQDNPLSDAKLRLISGSPTPIQSILNYPSARLMAD